MTKDPIAEALRDTLISPNVSDSNMESANIVDVADNIARALWCLGRMPDPDERPGAVQMLALQVRSLHDGLCRVADALNNIANAIREGKQ